MKKRVLGKTGLEVSLLGFGGFHLVEIPAEEAASLLNYYLDQGGNYLETAASYGDGESERKIGRVVAKRRNELVLASKTVARDYASAAAEIDMSLDHLNTDHLDILFLHAVIDEEELDQALAPGGALEAARDALKQGKIRHVGITSHGQPDTLIKALKTDEFELFMTQFNYFDRFNFPALEKELLPLAREKKLGTICMKPLADGFLWRSVDRAFQYAFTLPVDMVVTGMNSREMLEKDLALANGYQRMTEKQNEGLFRDAPELGTYICRQCDRCTVSGDRGEALKYLFKLEGYYDRQMRDGKPRNPADFALRDRLRFWFGNQEKAKKLYQHVDVNAADLLEICGNFSQCKYNLTIEQKLKIVHYKLGDDNSLY